MDTPTLENLIREFTFEETQQEAIKALSEDPVKMPFKPLASGSGGAGWSFRSGDQNFTTPKDNDSYMAVPYQNEDGSVFMELFRSEEKR